MSERGVRLIFRSDRRVERELFDVPTPGPGQMLVRVRRSHVSAGTEMNFLREHPVDGPLCKAALGYMTVGRVEQVGSGVAAFAVGDRILTQCPHASHCLVDVTPAACDGVDVAIDRLPAAVSADEAGFVVLGDVALHGIRRAGLQIDQSVVVFGCGIVGQLTIQLARLSGAYPVIAVDLFDHRLAKAVESGATFVVNASREDPVAAVREHTAGRGGEAVFHCASVPTVLQTALAVAAERGTVILSASPPGDVTIGLQAELLRHELNLIGNYEIGIEQPHGYWPWTRSRNRQACLRLLATGELRLSHLISHVVPFTQAEAMVETMAGSGDDWLGIVFRWEERDLSDVHRMTPRPPPTREREPT